MILNYSNTNIKDINDCKPDICTHGSCIDAVNLYTCACNPGYSGTKCAEGTSKLNILIWFTINCTKANITDINDCEPDPCTHGSCTDGVNSYICACDTGYSGTNCAKGTREFYI